MGKLLVDIRASYGKLSKGEKKIADYFLDANNEGRYLTITELSNVIGVSESTIVRFARKMNCNGYQEFKLLIAKEERRFVNKSINSNDGPKKIYAKICDDIYSTLLKTRDNLSDELLDNAYQDIISAKKIMLFGVGNSHSVCMDFYHKLFRLGLDVQVAQDSHFAVIGACQMDETSLFIGVSHSGYTIDVIDAVNMAKNKGAKIICVTSDNKSPLAKLSDIILLTSSDEINYRIMGLTSRFSQLAIFDTLYSYIVTKNEATKELIQTIEDAIFIKRVPNKKNK